MRSRRRPSVPAVLAVAVAAGLLVAACAPPRSRNAGFNGYATDIVLGAQSRPEPTTPPPIPGASLDPGFPSFLVPPPPEAPLPPATPGPTTTAKPVISKCPEAPVDVIPKPAAESIDKPPAAGPYPYRQTGTYVAAGKKLPYPEEVVRTLQNVKTDPTTKDISYEVATTQLGETTTMSYNIVKSASADVNGIYLTRQVHVVPGKAPDEFTPAPPGLRMFPMPASVGLGFRSTATDGTHQTSMILKGTVRERLRIDACGDLVEGWSTEVAIHVEKAGIPENGRTAKITATYVVVPQLGGLVVADKTQQSLADPQDPVVQDQVPQQTAPPTTQPTTVPLTTPATPAPRLTVRPEEVRNLVETNIKTLTPVKPK